MVQPLPVLLPCDCAAEGRTWPECREKEHDSRHDKAGSDMQRPRHGHVSFSNGQKKSDQKSVAEKSFCDGFMLFFGLRTLRPALSRQPATEKRATMGLSFLLSLAVAAQLVSAADLIVDGTTVQRGGVLPYYDNVRVINGGILDVPQYNLADPVNTGNLEISWYAFSVCPLSP
jgi:hypothetical protein